MPLQATLAQQSEVGICNQALSLIGVTEQIASLQEKSKAAIQCALWYAQTRDALLKSLAWPFAEKYAALAQSTDPQLPDNMEQFPGWMYTYAYPGDCLLVRHICDSGGVRMRFVQMDALYRDLLLYMPPRVPFSILRGSQGKVIACDIQNAYAIYTLNIQDPTQFDADYTMALVGALGARIAPGMRVDPSMVQTAIGVMVQSVRAAQAQAWNEAQEDPEPPAKSVQSRL